MGIVNTKVIPPEPPETFNLNLNPKKVVQATHIEEFNEIYQMGSIYRKILKQYYLKDNMIYFIANHSENISGYGNIFGDFLTPSLQSSVRFRMKINDYNQVDFHHNQDKNETFLTSKTGLEYKNTKIQIYNLFGNQYKNDITQLNFGSGIKATREMEIKGYNTLNTFGFYYDSIKNHNIYFLSKINDKITFGFQHKNDKKIKSTIQSYYELKNSGLSGKFNIYSRNLSVIYNQRLDFTRSQWFAWRMDKYQFFEDYLYYFLRQNIFLQNTIDFVIKMDLKGKIKASTHWQLNYDQSIKVYFSRKEIKASYIHQIFPNIDFITTLHYNYNNVTPVFGISFNSHENHKVFE